MSNIDQCIETNGKSAFLLKGTSKRKRRRSQIEEVKEEEKLLKQDKQKLLKDYKRLKNNQGPDSEEMQYL